MAIPGTPTAVKIHADERWMGPEPAVGGESMWADMQPDGTAVVDNILFFAYGVGYGDRVRLDRERWEIEDIVEHGVWITYRALAQNGIKRVNAIVGRLVPDSRREGAFDGLLAIAVKPGHAERLERLLERLEVKGIIDGWESAVGEEEVRD